MASFPWVNSEDIIPLQLAISLYTTPILELDTYIIQKQTARVGIWKDFETGIVIVGTRGTAIGQAGGSKDAADDLVSLANSSNVFAIA
jgi:hypothetical protein